MRRLLVFLPVLGTLGCGESADDRSGWQPAEVSPGAHWVLPKASAERLRGLVRPLAYGEEVVAGSGFRLVSFTPGAERLEYAISDGKRSVRALLFHRDVAGGIETTASFQIRLALDGMEQPEALRIAAPLIAALRANDDGRLWAPVKPRSGGR